MIMGKKAKYTPVLWKNNDHPEKKIYRRKKSIIGEVIGKTTTGLIRLKFFDESQNTHRIKLVRENNLEYLES